MSLPLSSSSGDLIADRRFEWARELAERGDARAAAELLEQTLELVPDFAAAWFGLGDLRAGWGDRGGAIEAFRRARAADPDDRHGAALRLARLGVAVGDAPMSPGYVRALFDQYAGRFDAALVGGLGYSAPQALGDAVESLGGARRFRRLVDLGCGTGLIGEALRSRCATLTGVDLSPAMLDMARRKGVYDQLAVADMTQWLGCEPDHAADLVVAADAFVYLADLGAVCRTIARVLEPGGLLAFTVETHAADGVMLGPKLRYAHGAGHVRAAVSGCGLVLLICAPASTRTENGVAVPGLVVVAGKS